VPPLLLPLLLLLLPLSLLPLLLPHCYAIGHRRVNKR
jgi:hypothetical protein